MASSSSVSSQGSQKYDVFLNFRGDDVRLNFLSHLILAFNHASLNIFVDNKLKRGEHIKSALMDAIQDSKVSLTIFSEGYASSAWCLDELVKIMDCRENLTLKQKVIPVFYHVTPSDVRNVQTGVFAQDFAKHESDHRSCSKVPRWKTAMEAAGDLTGIIVNKTSSEAHVVKQIVDEVSSKKPKDYANIQQLQRNGSISTISREQGLPVQEDLIEFLVSIRGQVEVKPSESHSGQRLETSNSYPSSPISYHYGGDQYGPGSTIVPTNPVTQEGLPMSSSTFACGGGNNTNGYGLGGTMVPYSSMSMSNGNCLDLGNGNWRYGYPMDYGNGQCGYLVDLGNDTWSYYVVREDGNLYPYELDDDEQAGQGPVKKRQKLKSFLKTLFYAYNPLY